MTGRGLLVVGDVVTDVVARHRGPLAAGTDTAAAIRTVPGGAGANVACWAAYRGCPDVTLLGRVGAESVRWHEEALVRAGVRPRLVVDPDAPTGSVVCLVDAADGGERTFLTDSGACLRIGPEDWSAGLLDGVGRLHLSGYLFFSATGRELVAVAVRDARARGVPVSVDPASAGFLRELGAERFLELAEGVDVLLPSRDEAVLLASGAGAIAGDGAGDGGVGGAAAGLSRRFPVVVVKAGADGACVAWGGVVREWVEAVPGVVVRDATGAGDAFVGAVVGALVRGASWGAALGDGCRAGAEAVGVIGGRPPEGS
ncbi:carbohydrate kinase family protein [Streptomyces sp. NPDC050145]|uniref:carbohydrate kinase family protein n=1 Tax=Streptomyces sp. NPDC050145 TaxID=3365602 RepID=UPI00378C1013